MNNNRTINRIVRFILLACACNALPVAALADNGGASNSIQAVNVRSIQDGKLMVSIILKNPPASVPGHFSTMTPPRVAFDFPATTNAAGKSLQEVNQGDLHNINIIQAGSRTRLVLNLNNMMSYDTKVEGNSVLVTLSALVSAPPTTHFAEEQPATKSHSVRNIDFRRGLHGEGQVIVTLSDAGTGIDLHQQGSKVVVDFINTRIPRDLQRKLDVLDFATPVESIDTFEQGKNVRLVVSPLGVWDQDAYQTNNKFVLEIKPKAAEREKKGAKPVYSKEKMTLNFQSISVREALSVIADFTGLNIVISDSVSGSLTLRLHDVPWDQALDIILKTKGLDMERDGNVIQVAPQDEIAAHRKVQNTIAQEVDDLSPLHTESFQLSFQKGGDVVKLLASKDQRILSKRGSAVVDEKTNILFVQDTVERLEEVRKLISQIDVPMRQVMIEARFVSATEKFSRTLGGNLSFNSTNQAAPTAGFHVGGGQLGNATGAVNLPGANSGTGGLSFSLFNPANTKTLQLELTATEIEGTTKNIASPRVVTGDNVAAEISAGTAIPYQQATTSGATSVAFKDATLKLNVQPKITPDDHVDMKLTVTQDTVGGIYNGMVGIDTKKVDTDVVVDNGGTVAIGGVYTKDVTESTTKVPLLGDVPIIGWLFKNNSKTDNRSELLIFVTPRILKDSLNLK